MEAAVHSSSRNFIQFWWWSHYCKDDGHVRTYKVRDMHCPQLIRENGRHPTSHGLWPSQELSVHPQCMLSLLTSWDRLSLCTCMCSSVTNGLVTVCVVPSLLLLCRVSFPLHLTITFQVVQGGRKLQWDISDMKEPLSVTKMSLSALWLMRAPWGRKVSLQFTPFLCDCSITFPFGLTL